jgi:hypothetical protein
MAVYNDLFQKVNRKIGEQRLPKAGRRKALAYGDRCARGSVFQTLRLEEQAYGL